MNRALRVLSRQSAVAEPAAGAGSKAREGAPGSSATATSCPPCGRQAGSSPCRGRTCWGMSWSQTSHAHPGPMPAGHSNAAPMGCRWPWSRPLPTPQVNPFSFQGGAALAAAFRWPEPYLLFMALTWGCPWLPRLKRRWKGEKKKKVIADKDSVRLPLSSTPSHSHGEHSLPRTAESLDNCPAINLPLCLRRGIKMLLLFGFFLENSGR